MESAILALEDGTVFEGRSFGAPAERSGEVVFNTAITGYQEIFTDPSYSGQIVILTNPQIGNYGTSSEDNESAQPYIEGLVVREFSALSSNWRSDRKAEQFLAERGIPIVSDLDTRTLVRHLRTRGVMRGVLSAIETDPATLVQRAREIPSMAGLDLASRVSTRERYEWSKPVEACSPSEIVPRPPEPRYHVVAYDFGIKHNILRRLVQVGCRVTVVPALTSAEDVLALKPNGVFLSNGPGDPEPLVPEVANIRKLIGKTPIFGICLGHQLLGLAVGGKTYKMKFGHRGANHPVINKVTQRVEITSHNHGFAVDPDSLNLNEVDITHMNLNDQTLEGFRHRNHPLFCVQYHPEAAPGPHDSHYLFDDFVKLMAEESQLPRRNDLHRILIIGSGPIIIGQACEFDYSGTQAARALRSDGYEVVLVNSNPATIMTDPELADRTYVEPLTRTYVEEIIKKERPDALLSTVGGQTGLNLSVELAEAGVLDHYGVELIGAKIDAIKKAEDRLLFKDAMRKIGLETPLSQLVRNVKDGLDFASRAGYPAILRPSFTMGGSGGGIAYNSEELIEILEGGLSLSPVHEVLIEESALGWKEFELEVMRDLADNCIIVCSIENFDPMGVHTGDSITVAPAQTLTDREYQMMRDGAIRCLREIGVDTGGSNVQFAINPQNGRMVIIEMNPRVSRSSALASKATGFPIAKIAAKLAVGYRLDEIRNDITRKTPACFEPTIDYVVVKIPKWQFEKFPGAEPTLGTQMKSVGEVMAIGRTFKEALSKGIRSLETGKAFGSEKFDKALVAQKLITPTPDRLNYIRYALANGYTVAQVQEMTAVDPWFLEQIKEVTDFEADIQNVRIDTASKETLLRAKRYGLSDIQLAKTWKTEELTVRARRKELGINAVFNRVDTCAAEFESFTPYLYSCYETSCEADPGTGKKVMILGSGPNRIGQGIEFDYCCCHASFALRAAGVESIMVNCNPETVSTDYDTSSRLYFEPLTLEHVLNIYDTEKPDGVIVQFGGQTPLTLALPLKRLGVPIIGTDPENIDLAEDRKLFGKLLDDLGIPSPENGTATSVEEACAVARRIGYPVLLRPSYVLGGRAMVIAYDEEMIKQYMREAVSFSQDRPVLIDRFLEDAIEIDVDALGDTENVLIAGIMEHIEEAGVHSGDSSCVLPPQSIKRRDLDVIEDYTVRLAKALKVIGLMNVQYAIQNGKVYVLEVNPRASRTAPYVSKATGVPLPKIAVGLMLGKKLRDFTEMTGGRFSGVLPVPQDFVKSPVFPFNKFPGVDPALGPEMRSTGEVMGVGENFGEAFLKAQISAGAPLPEKGTVFLSVNDHHKQEAVEVARRFAALGFNLVATRGTASALANAGLRCRTVFKVNEGRPNAVDLLKGGSIQLAIYTTTGAPAFFDEKAIRRTAVMYRVPCITTMAGARAAADAAAARQRDPIRVWSLQEIHQRQKVAEQ